MLIDLARASLRWSGTAGAMIVAINPEVGRTGPRTWQRAGPRRCHRATVHAETTACPAAGPGYRVLDTIMW